MTHVRDLRDFYPPREVASALKELAKDPAFQTELRRAGKRHAAELLTTAYPLKYLGIELREGGRTRFPLATALRIALRPRTMDGASRGLRLSVHRKAFLERFPDVDAALSARPLFAAGPKAATRSAAAFAASEYAALAQPALARLRALTGVPIATAHEVLRKGLAAFRAGHRPGMSAHGWARARLTSFVMKGCTHFFPDHQLARACPERTQAMWRAMPCLCRKTSQCGAYGTRTRANAAR
jgi:hypothetical protein